MFYGEGNEGWKVSEEAQSRMNVLQLYQDECCTGKAMKDKRIGALIEARLMRFTLGYTLLYFR